MRKQIGSGMKVDLKKLRGVRVEFKAGKYKQLRQNNSLASNQQYVTILNHITLYTSRNQRAHNMTKRGKKREQNNNNKKTMMLRL